MMKNRFVSAAVALAGLFVAARAAQASDPFALPDALSKRAVFSCTDLSLSGAGIIDSQGIANNTAGTQGNVATNGNISMSGSAIIKGNAVVGPGKTFNISGTASVTGTKTVATATESCAPINLAPLNTSLAASNDNSHIPLTSQGHVALSGANHTDLVMSGSDSLALPPGTYYLTRISLSGTTSITLSGATRIFCNGPVSLSGGTVVNQKPYGLRLFIYGTGSSFSLSGSSAFNAFVYVPGGSASISGARVIGGIFANSFSMSGTTPRVTRAVDDVGPTVTITQPADGAVVADPAHVLVKGTATDDQTPLALQVNGQNVAIADDGTWQVTLNLSGTSPATITATATDSAGNVASAHVTVTTAPPPVLTLGSPAPGSFVNTRIVSLTGGAGNATAVTVNGVAAAVTSGVWTLNNFDLGPDGAHTLTIIGTGPGGSSTITPVVTSDTVAPTIQASAAPPANAAGWNKTDVTVSFTCSDSGSGIATCPAAVTVTSEGAGITVTRSAVDRAGNSTPVTVTLNIDKTAPHMTFTGRADGDVVTDPRLVVSGGADDAVTVTVNGSAATVNTAAATFTSSALTLVEGSNAVTATGVDRAGNSGSATINVVLDSRAPQLAITAPAANACLNATSVTLSGTVSDAHLQDVKVGATAATVTAGTWTATIPNVAEGRQLFTVTATDTLGHSAVATVTVNVDRTAPTIDVTESGVPFTKTLVNHDVSLLVRANDASNVTVNATLDGAAYTSGTTISAEGAHTLAVTAVDCAGLQAQKTLQFTIDRTPPTISNLAPAAGTTVGGAPNAIAGTASEAATVSLAGTALSGSTDAAKNFSIASVPFAEGENAFTLHAVDAAGNAADVPYRVTVHSAAPALELLENGVPIVSGATYNRAITPQVRVNPSDASVAATLDAQPFTLGTSVSAETTHTFSATATDLLGHTTSASRTFTIDTHGPVVKITSPAGGATIAAAQVPVTGDAGDSVALTVNGVTAAIASGHFSAVVPLEPGDNNLVALGRDRAGNAGSDTITVTQSQATSGVVITYPPDTFPTNRRTTLVTGRVLTPADLQTLTIEGKTDAAHTTGVLPVTADAGGAFTVPDLPLFEGVDTITVTSTSKSNAVSTAVVHVNADLTPPSVRILNGANELQDGGRYPSAVTLTVAATDNLSTPTTTLQVDGIAVTPPAVVSANGGHTAVAVAADAAHNEARVVRTFFIGAQGGAGCALGNFDPADGAVVTANSVTLVGTSSGAASVTVNNIPAAVANGMFRATVELPAEGPNSVTIACAGATKTITLLRVTAAPSIAIDTPAEMAPLGSETTTVTGTVGGQVTSVDVNGTPAVISGTAWTASNVHLAAGLNVLVAHAVNAAGRVATATRRVVYLKNAPSISISWPNNGYSTGAAIADVSGTYANLDPTTIATAAGGTRETHVYSDTSGGFVLRGVPLTAGAQTIAISGHDALNRAASANVSVTRADGAPSIAITAPLDNSYVSAATVPVSGAYVAVAGSQIDINGTAAALNADGTFTGSAALAAGGATAIVARLTQPDNSTAVATVFVTRLAAAPSVVLTFPADNAVSVDAGVIVLVSFSAPMDKATLQPAFSLLNGAGQPVSGQFRLDRDVLSFAPAAALNPGERYTIDVKTTATDLAGNALDHELTAHFTVASSAAAPHVDAITAPVCGSSVTISGTAAPGARVRVDFGGATLFTTANSTGAFTQLLGISSQSGYYVARVRVIGQDGSLSSAAEVPFTVDCAGATVLAATYDRTANAIAVTFSTAIDLSSVTVGPSGSVHLQLEDGTAVSGTAAAGSSSSIVVITPGTPDPRALTLLLSVTTGVKDASGRNLTAPFSQTFTVGGDQQGASGGDGYVSGQIIDATNGRPLGGAAVAIGGVNTASRSNGSYTRTMPEGAYTIHASATGYTDVWRQVVVGAGQGVTPIDIRLTARGVSATMAASDISINHGGDTTVTRRATLDIVSGAIPAGAVATLTAVGAQGLAGLLPFGWSPLAAAEVRVSGSVPAATGRLTFQIPGAQVAASGKVLTGVAYDSSRDVWRVVAPVVAVTGDTAQVTFALSSLTEVALVYPDGGSVAAPPAPVAGGVLAGVAYACASGCPAMQVTRPFDLNPKIVTPTGTTVATLTIDVTGNPFPSGTAIDALVNEELRLVGGGVQSDVPYSADLILYRTLAGDGAVADFKLTPSAQAAQVPLQIGFDHIQILPYPGRLDRGTLVGPAGGRIPSDAVVQVEIPTGATSIALHASARSMTSADLAAFGTIAGFQIVSGFTLTLDPADATQTFTALVKPASVTFSLDASAATGQLILAEVLPATAFGRVFRLADRMNGLTTVPVDVAVLPVDGIVRAGQYLLLRAAQPIAFAFGGVRIAGGAYVGGAEVVASSLGVRDVARAGGIFAIPVVAKPAAPFALTPVHPNLGEGAAFTAAAAPDPGQIVAVGDLLFAVQAPALQHVNVSGAQGAVDLLANNGAGEISLSTGVQAVFSQSIDLASVDGNSIVVTDNATSKAVPGSVTAGATAVTWTPTPNPAGQPLVPNATYVVTVSASIRGSHGAPLGASQTLSFSTITQLTSTQIHPERIRITVPDANGFSTISGDAGALATVPPETRAWRAVALRRGNVFVTQYQVTANNDGSFTLAIGNCGGGVKCGDAVTIRDHIDLEILNAADNIAAILPLTPFVSADGQAFIAPDDVATDFTSKDGVGVHVPAGAFDQPTTVRVARLDTDAPFAAVPSIHDEMTFFRGVNVTFDCTTGGVAAGAAAPAPCVAKKRLDLSIPVAPPPSPDPAGRNLVLGWLGDSVRGQRVMVVDTIRVDNGKLTTAEAGTGGQSGPAKVTILSSPPKISVQSSSPKNVKTAATPVPTIDSFTAAPVSILGGQPSHLAWSTSNAPSVTLQNVTKTPPQTLASSPSGSLDVTPSETTTYRLTAVNGSTLVTQDVTVVLTKAPIGGVLTGADVKKALMGVLREGMYDVGELRSSAGPVGWVLMDGLQGNFDIFSDRWNSLFASHIYLNESHGRAIMPAVLGKPFELVGYDAGTGLQAFSKVYDPLPTSDPGAAYVVPTPQSDAAGPYPVLGSPLGIDVVDILAEDHKITSARNLVVRLHNNIVTVSNDAEDPLPSSIVVRVLNVTSGASQNYSNGPTPPLTVSGKVGDRIVIMRGAENVDPSAEISLVFNKAIYSGSTATESAIDSYLHDIFKLEKASKPLPGVPPSYTDINDLVKYRVDSGNLRLKALLPSSMERGAFYRLTLKKELADQTAGGPSGPTAGLTIGQVTLPTTAVSAPLANDITIEFQVREVPDALTAFNIRQDAGTPKGLVRDMALNGNTLLIAALDGGILAYDVANPAAMDSNTLPVGRVDAGPNQFWSVVSDEHGRVYATGLGNTFGFIQSYRLDDFYQPCAGSAADPCPKRVTPRSSTVTSWAPGYGSGIDSATGTTLSDRPEGIPRKLQIAVQDNDHRFDNRMAFIAGLGAIGGSVVSQSDIGQFKRMTLHVNKEGDNKYRLQRITIENLTRDMRWSGDAIDGTPATIDNVVAEENDQLRVVFNERTWGVVSIFGYGVGVFDLNAVESNDVTAPPPPDAVNWSERIRLTSAGLGQACSVATGDNVIQDLSFSAESALIPSTSSADFTVYGLDIHRGVLDLRIEAPEPPPAGAPPSIQPAACDDRSPVGLRFVPAVSPRIAALGVAFSANAASGGRQPAGRFAAVQTYHWTLEAQDNKALAQPPAGSTTPPPGARGSAAGTRVVRDYLLVPANEYGLLIVDATKPAGWLGQGSLADIIWVPAGAVSARMIPRTSMAIVVDGQGRVLLVDLSRIDERWDEQGNLVSPNALFKTAAAALNKPQPVDENGPYGVGASDPRIVWTSKSGVVNGSIVPVIDPDTGILFAGKLLVDPALEKAMSVIPALDPRIQIRADIGKGGMAEIGGVVPLGIDPPDGILNTSDANASFGAFRLQLALPGAMAEALPGSTLRIAVESERVPGAPSEQTPDPFPRAHFRMTTPSGNTEPRQAPGFNLQRDIPAGMESVLRRQRGFNKFISPWVVAIADPRAAEKFVGTSQQKKDAGCASCDRPARLKGKLESDGVYELWSGGRFLAARPELTSGSTDIFSGTPYAYLGKAHRLEAHFPIVPGRPVRPTAVLVPAQNPPMAEGMLQETTYLHSGEVETNDVDLDAGGRAGVDVIFARRHRSRTLGTLFLGEGWDSPMFRFLIPLPNGKVEYHDGGGEVFTYSKNSSGVYEAPGLFLKLTSVDNGWSLVDQKWRVTKFDSFGRLASESDEFATGRDLSKGNTIRYLYDLDGHLAAIVDPVNRVSTLAYWKESEALTTGAYVGRLKEITDWRGRVVTYGYDASGRLASVKQSQVANGLSSPLVFTGRPETRYGYEAPATASVNDPPQSQGWTNFVEFFGNIDTVKDPAQVVVSGATPRVTFTYDLTTSALRRDRVVLQQWATGEAPTFDYPSSSTTTSIDALIQSREYDLTDAGDFDQRVHIKELREKFVPTITFVGGLPQPAPVNLTGSLQDHRTTFDYNEHGQVIRRTGPDLRKDEPGYVAASSPVGTTLQKITTSGPLLPPTETNFKYDTVNTNAANTVTDVGRKDPVTVNGSDPVYREVQQPSRERLETTRSDDGSGAATPSATVITTKTTWNPDGQLKSVKVTGGTDSLSRSITYYGVSSTNQNERARPFLAMSGNNDLFQVTTYEPEGAGEKVVSTDDIRHIVTETHTDALDRPVHRIVKDASNQVVTDESFGYDATGRLSMHTRAQEGVGTIEETFSYDAVGRPTGSTTSGAKVDGTASTTVRTKTTYDLANRQIVTFDPYTSTEKIKTTATFDGFGRTVKTERQAVAGGDVVRSVSAYDMHGQLAYQTDTVRLATVRQFDLLGREIKSVHSDGTSTSLSWDAWGQLLESIAFDSGNAETAHTKNFYTFKGRPVIANEQETATGGARQTFYRLDDGEKKTSVRVGQVDSINLLDNPTRLYRIAQTTHDLAGRVEEEVRGEALGGVPTIADNAKIFSRTTYNYLGGLPSLITSYEPKVSATYNTTPVYDGLYRLSTVEAPGGYTTDTHFDEAGNPLTVKRPGIAVESTAFDSRGLAITRTLPDSKTQQMQYDERGVLRQYGDEEGKLTRYDTDPLGRVNVTHYLGDNTTEEVRYENITGMVHARKDRAGQWLSYIYDPGGRVTEVHPGEDPTVTPAILVYQYDSAGRLTLVKNKDAGIEYGEYDFLGRPHLTRSYRYLGGSGIGSLSPAIIDTHTQRHEWSVFDERRSWTMPVAGSTVSSDDLTSPWLQTIIEDRDAGSNLVKQSTPAGATLSQSNARSAGRIDLRTVPTSGASPIQTTFGFADGVTPLGGVELPPVFATTSSVSGLPLWNLTEVNGTRRAGSSNGRDTAARLHDVRDLATERFSFWSYDARSRLSDSRLGVSNQSAAPTSDTLSDADFRSERTPPPLFTPSEHTMLGAAASLAIEPQRWKASQTDAHQIDQRTLYFEGSPQSVRAYGFAGGRRTTDGVWASAFDEMGRLKSLTNATAGRKIEFEWDPNDRIAGRAAYQSDGSGGWTLETRPSILTSDGLPAETTFVWDPIVDHLVAIYTKGASSVSGAAATAGLLRQYLHGDQGYDDPIEVRAADTPGGTPKRYFPIIDHAGAGSLQATLGDNGDVLERVLYADSYGDAPRYLQGPFVDKVTFEPTKSATGTLDSVKIRVHLDERVVASSVAASMRLASIKADQSTAFALSTAPTVDDPHTLLWSMNATDWSSLVSATGAQTLEIAVKDTLRCEGWGNAAVQPVPSWALRIYGGTATTTQMPVIVRESFASLSGFVGALASGATDTRTLYAIPNLYLAGVEQSKTRLFTGFKSAPFIEPATALAYFRERWYDPATGVWLTGDGVGYRDSSNLYAAFGLDPVDNVDPTGECIGLDTVDCTQYAMDIDEQLNDPRNWWGNAKRSARFGAFELKGAALAIPRLVKGIYDVASHPVETWDGLTNLASAVADDPLGMAQRAGNAIINVNPDTAGEFVGENLFFAALGAAAKTPEVAAAARRMGMLVRGTEAAEDANAGARAAMRARVLKNIEASRAARPTENFLKYAAVDAQSIDPYVPDVWDMVTLRKGAIIAGGHPMSSFFTDVGTVLKSGLSGRKLWEATQVYSRTIWGPRKAITLYEVLEDIRVPAGQTLRNVGAGGGGGGQFFLRPWKARKVLRAIGTYRLH
jgi:RHS repeat-associated protein